MKLILHYLVCKLCRMNTQVKFHGVGLAYLSKSVTTLGSRSAFPLHTMDQQVLLQLVNDATT